MDAGLTQGQVAERIARDQSLISRVERGLALPDEAVLGAMFLVYNITDDEEREEFLQLAREAADPNWVSGGRRLAALIAEEKAAQKIVNVEPMIVPGLCQTEDYARSLAIGMGATQEQADQRARDRLERQAILEHDRAPELWAYIGEHAFRDLPCDVTVMAEQVRKLLTLGELPNVSIFVLPFNSGVTPAFYGSFLLTYPRRGDPLVRLEPYASTTTLSSRRHVRTYQAAVDAIHRKVMSAAGSAAFIGKLLNEMERGT